MTTDPSLLALKGRNEKPEGRGLRLVRYTIPRMIAAKNAKDSIAAAVDSFMFISIGSLLSVWTPVHGS